MDKTVYQIIDMVRKDLRQDHDEAFLTVNDTEYMIKKMNDVRAILVMQEYNSRNTLNTQYYQTSHCNEVQYIKASCVINGLSFTSHDSVATVTISPMITDIGWEDIAYLGGSNMPIEAYTRKSQSGFIAYKGNIYGSDEPMFYLHGDTIILRNLPSDQRFITISGVYYDPTSVCDFNRQTDTYPVPNVFKFVTLVKKDLIQALGLPKDIFANMQEDIALGQGRVQQPKESNNEQQ